jgi:hypothetical protein
VTSFRRAAPPRALQSGRTIVELMIAITIALGVVAGMAGAYVGASRTAKVAGQLAGIADSGQLAMMLIGDAIRQSGYGEIVGSDFVLGSGDVGAYRSQTLFGDGPNLAGCSGAPFADDTAPAPACGAAVNPNFDALMVRFQGDAMIPPPQGPITDCLGVVAPPQPLPADHVGTSRSADRPLVQNAYFGANGGLWCRGNGRGAVGDAFAAAQQLVANVEQFKVYYGFDDVRFANPGAAAAPTMRSLRDAAFLNALPADAQPWDYVVSVHVCMRVRSGETDGTALAVTASNTVVRCPMNAVEAAGPPQTEVAGDRALRRTYSQVFTVRARSTANPREFLP